MTARSVRCAQLTTSPTVALAGLRRRWRFSRATAVHRCCTLFAVPSTSEPPDDAGQNVYQMLSQSHCVLTCDCRQKEWAPPGVEPGALPPEGSMFPLHHSATTMGVRGIEPRLWRSHHQVLAITLHSLWACGIAGGPRCLYTAAAAGAVRVAAPAPRPRALTVGSPN